jgi:hypothetical protein
MSPPHLFIAGMQDAEELSPTPPFPLSQIARQPHKGQPEPHMCAPNKQNKKGKGEKNVHALLGELVRQLLEQLDGLADNLLAHDLDQLSVGIETGAR